MQKSICRKLAVGGKHSTPRHTEQQRCIVHMVRNTLKYVANKDMKVFAKIIKGMMDEGIVVKDDPKLLAVELTAPAVLQIARSDRQPQCEKECMEYIEMHLRHFCKVYMR